MANGINMVLLHVNDVKAARDFYVEKLGVKVEDEQPGFVQFETAPGTATLALSSNADSHKEALELWWYVENADASYQSLVEQGVEIVSPPVDLPFGRTFTIKGEDGHNHYLLQLRQS